MAYLGKYLKKVFVSSVTIPCKKRRKNSQRVFIVTLATVYPRNKAAAKEHRAFHTGGVQGWDVGTDPMPKEWCLCRGTCKTVRLRVLSPAVSSVGACAGW